MFIPIHLIAICTQTVYAATDVFAVVLYGSWRWRGWLPHILANASGRLQCFVSSGRGGFFTAFIVSKRPKDGENFRTLLTTGF